MKNKRGKIEVDNIGMTASILCAVHCAVVPFLITSLPLLGLGFLANPWFEWGMIIFALSIGVYAIGLSYLRTHRRILPLILLIIGFLIIIAGHLYVRSWKEALIVPLGGLLIAYAHFVNFKYTGVCRQTTPHFHLKHLHQAEPGAFVEPPHPVLSSMESPSHKGEGSGSEIGPAKPKSSPLERI